MADIYHTFLDDEQEAEYHFRKAHGASKCAVCGGEGGKRYTDYVPYGSTRAAYETWDACEACDGLGLERVNVYTMNSLWGYGGNILEIATEVEGGAYCRDSVYYSQVDQEALMNILKEFAPKAYAIECMRQGVTP